MDLATYFIYVYEIYILLCKAFFLQKIERFFIFSENCINNLNINTIDNNYIMEEYQESITMEELHSETINGMIMLSCSLNPLEEEWELIPDVRSDYHLRGKRRKRIMRKNYLMEKGTCPCPLSTRLPWGRDTTCCTICYVTSDGIDISDSITLSYNKKKDELNVNGGVVRTKHNKTKFIIKKRMSFIVNRVSMII